MNNQQVLIFFDDVVRDYAEAFENEYEKILVEHLHKHLLNLSVKSEITIITRQDTKKIKIWFEEHDLYKFIKEIKV